MSTRKVLSEVIDLPRVGGIALCTEEGDVITEEISSYLNEYVQAVLRGKIAEVREQFKTTSEDFIELPVPDSGYAWIAKRGDGFFLLAILYPDADTYMVKLHLDFAADSLSKQKKGKKGLSEDLKILIATRKQVRLLDVISFKQKVDQDEYTRGIIVSKQPYDDRVREELAKHRGRIQIVIAEDMKKERKRLAEQYSAQGYKVKETELVTDRGW